MSPNSARQVTQPIQLDFSNTMASGQMENSCVEILPRRVVVYVMCCKLRDCVKSREAELLFVAAEIFMSRDPETPNRSPLAGSKASARVCKSPSKTPAWAGCPHPTVDEGSRVGESPTARFRRTGH